MQIFKKKLTEKKPKLFLIENLIHCFCARLYIAVAKQLAKELNSMAFQGRTHLDPFEEIFKIKLPDSKSNENQSTVLRFGYHFVIIQ